MSGVFYVNFNPNWGTRFQHVDHCTFGPYSTLAVAEKVRGQILTQMGWPTDTPCADLVETTMDNPREIQIGGGPYKRIRTHP